MLYVVQVWVSAAKDGISTLGVLGGMLEFKNITYKIHLIFRILG